jgi:hypothetical protein
VTEDEMEGQEAKKWRTASESGRLDLLIEQGMILLRDEKDPHDREHHAQTVKLLIDARTVL